MVPKGMVGFSPDDLLGNDECSVLILASFWISIELLSLQSPTTAAILCVVRHTVRSSGGVLLSRKIGSILASSVDCNGLYRQGNMSLGS